MNVSVGSCCPELAQAHSSVALAWHKVRGSTPFGVTYNQGQHALRGNTQLDWQSAELRGSQRRHRGGGHSLRDRRQMKLFSREHPSVQLFAELLVGASSNNYSFTYVAAG